MKLKTRFNQKIDKEKKRMKLKTKFNQKKIKKEINSNYENENRI